MTVGEIYRDFSTSYIPLDFSSEVVQITIVQRAYDSICSEVQLDESIATIDAIVENNGDITLPLDFKTFPILKGRRNSHIWIKNDKTNVHPIRVVSAQSVTDVDLYLGGNITYFYRDTVVRDGSRVPILKYRAGSSLAGETVTLSYVKRPERFNSLDDTPEQIPDEFHDIIVFSLGKYLFANRGVKSTEDRETLKVVEDLRKQRIADLELYNYNITQGS